MIKYKIKGDDDTLKLPLLYIIKKICVTSLL